MSDSPYIFDVSGAASFEQLIEGLVALDFGPIYQKWRGSPPLPAGEVQPGDRRYRPAREKVSGEGGR